MSLHQARVVLGEIVRELEGAIVTNWRCAPEPGSNTQRVPDRADRAKSPRGLRAKTPFRRGGSCALLLVQDDSIRGCGTIRRGESKRGTHSSEREGGHKTLPYGLSGDVIHSAPEASACQPLDSSCDLKLPNRIPVPMGLRTTAVNSGRVPSLLARDRNPGASLQNRVPSLRRSQQSQPVGHHQDRAPLVADDAQRQRDADQQSTCHENNDH